MSTEVKVASIPDCDLWEIKPSHDKHVPAAYDGKTNMGPWAYMCEDCFQRFGVGLGTGKGQRLILAKD